MVDSSTAGAARRPTVPFEKPRGPGSVNVDRDVTILPSSAATAGSTAASKRKQLAPTILGVRFSEDQRTVSRCLPKTGPAITSGERPSNDVPFSGEPAASGTSILHRMLAAGSSAATAGWTARNLVP